MCPRVSPAEKKMENNETQLGRVLKGPNERGPVCMIRAEDAVERMEPYQRGYRMDRME